MISKNAVWPLKQEFQNSRPKARAALAPPPRRETKENMTNGMTTKKKPTLIPFLFKWPPWSMLLVRRRLGGYTGVNGSNKNFDNSSRVNQWLNRYPLVPYLSVKGVCKMGPNCRFTHSLNEAQKLKEATEANGGVAPTIGAFRGPPVRPKVKCPYPPVFSSQPMGAVFGLSLSYSWPFPFC